MIILGIDPAIRCTGYGIINAEAGDRMQILDCGIIRNTAKMPHTECLRRLAGGIDELISAFKPEKASIEAPFVGKNAKTAIILGMARGAILARLGEHEIPVYSYSPRKAKRAAVGNGAAAKEQIALMMAAQFGIEVKDIPLDATDALALAICLAQTAVNPDLAFMLPKAL